MASLSVNAHVLQSSSTFLTLCALNSMSTWMLKIKIDPVKKPLFVKTFAKCWIQVVITCQAYLGQPQLR